MTTRRQALQFLAASSLAVSTNASAQAPRAPRVGLLILANPEPYWTLFRDGFREAGHVDGKNIQLDFRSADGKPDALASHIAEFVRTKVDLIIAIQTPVIKSAKEATRQIPILFMAGNPVETGLVASLNRPGGNLTGMSLANLELTAKTLEIMRETLPALRRVSVLINANDLAFGQPMLEQTQAAGRSRS